MRLPILRRAEENKESAKAAERAARAEANQQATVKEMALMDPLWREREARATERVPELPQETAPDPEVPAEMARVAELHPRAMARAEVRPAMEAEARARKGMAAAMRPALAELTDREAGWVMTRSD